MKRRNIIMLICAILFIVVAVLFFFFFIWPNIPKRNHIEESVREELNIAIEKNLQDEKTSALTDSSGYAEDTEKEDSYKSPVDFDQLKELNEDIYAWIYIPGTNISYPILQHSDDDTYYLKRNTSRMADAAGALFTERNYNSKDFNDPVTVVYGHKMKNGSMFGKLQEFYSTEFDRHKEIFVYLPDRELKYEVFAAIPYGNEHLLYKYEFNKQGIFTNFFKNICSTRKLGSTVDADAVPTEQDKVLILSTCTYEYNSNRFLVMARLIK